MKKPRPIELKALEPVDLHNLFKKLFVEVNGFIPTELSTMDFDHIHRQLGKLGFTHVVDGNDRIELVNRLEDYYRVEAAATANKILMMPEGETFRRVANFVDLILEPEAADSVIGDLFEDYSRRCGMGRGHLKRWLIAQLGWIIFGRALDIVRRAVRARAGK
jgi:hypothetical protein